jgi:hypothetical protein
MKIIGNKNAQSIFVPALCGYETKGHACLMPATYETKWSTTLCDIHYEDLKELIERNEAPAYDWHVCSESGCGRGSFNTVYNIAYPDSERWLCERHWRKARMVNMVQEQTGGWTLCNLCHQPLDLLDGFAKDARGSFIARNVHEIEEPVTCYLVTPAVVQLEQIPPCFLEGCFGVGENWHKLHHTQFVICGKCFDTFAVTPTTITCNHNDCRMPAIQHVKGDGGDSWWCEEHWQDQPELEI